MLPTIADIRGKIDIFDEFEFDDNSISNYLDEAQIKVKLDEINDDMQKFAIISWVRHLLYVDWFMKEGGTLSGTSLGQSQSIADMRSDDPYLNKYNQIKLDYGNFEEFGQVWTE